MALSNAKRCKATSKRTGKRCGQPAVKGFDVCRFHGANPGGGAGRPEGSKNLPASRKGGAPPGNANAMRHGAYSARLLPEEEPIYEEKRKAFTDALGTVDVFDEQIIHLLTVISVRVDQALLRGAEHAAYGGMIRQILNLMQQLQVTRASRDRLTDGQGLTYADLFAAMKAHLREAGKEGSEKAAVGSVTKAIEHDCSHCGFSMEHKLEDDGRWRCQNCGHLTDIETDDDKETVADSKQAGIA